MTKLERRCRLLLRAYPAQYRRDRGEEMLGTLLDTTPPGRTWPLLRDARALLAGGVRARVALNRQLSLGASLHTAAYAGVTAYLGVISVGTLGGFARAAVTASGRAQLSRLYDWPYFIGIALLALTVALAIADSRRVVVLIGALPAAALLSYGAAGSHAFFPTPGTYVVYLAILVALSGRSVRLARWWRWPAGLVAVSSLLLAFGPGRGSVLFFVVVMAFAAISLACIPVDPRPAIAVCAFVLVYWLPITIDNFASVSSGPLLLVPAAIALAIAALAAWRVAYQSANAPRRRI